MRRVNYPVVIVESEAELTIAERKLRGSCLAMRVRMLRLLKSGQCPTLNACEPLLGYSHAQLDRWWALYKAEGLSALIQVKDYRRGRHARITEPAWQGLEKELEAGQIRTLEDARSYLVHDWGIEYSVNGISYHFQKHRVRLKTGRPRHRKANPQQQEAFKKTVRLK